MQSTRHDVSVSFGRFGDDFNVEAWIASILQLLYDTAISSATSVCVSYFAAVAGMNRTEPCGSAISRTVRLAERAVDHHEERD